MLWKFAFLLCNRNKAFSSAYLNLLLWLLDLLLTRSSVRLHSTMPGSLWLFKKLTNVLSNCIDLLGFFHVALMLKARSRREWRKDRPPALTRVILLLIWHSLHSALMVWMSGSGEFWKELLFSTDVWTNFRAEVIFRIKWRLWADSLVKLIGQFSDYVIGYKTCVKVWQLSRY